MPESKPDHSHTAQSLTEQMGALTDRVDGDLAAVFERLEQQDHTIAA